VAKKKKNKNRTSQKKQGGGGGQQNPLGAGYEKQQGATQDTPARIRNNTPLDRVQHARAGSLSTEKWFESGGKIHERVQKKQRSDGPQSIPNWGERGGLDSEMVTSQERRDAKKKTCDHNRTRNR